MRGERETNEQHRPAISARRGGVKESNKREPGELQGPSYTVLAVLVSPACRSLCPVRGKKGVRIPLSDKIPTRLRLLPGQRLSTALFFSRFSSPAIDGGWKRIRSRGWAPRGLDDGGDSRWSGRLRSFRALTRLIAGGNPGSKVLEFSEREPVHLKSAPPRKRSHARFRRACFASCRGYSACSAR